MKSVLDGPVSHRLGVQASALGMEGCTYEEFIRKERIFVAHSDAPLINQPTMTTPGFIQAEFGSAVAHRDLLNREGLLLHNIR